MNSCQGRKTSEGVFMSLSRVVWGKKEGQAYQVKPHPLHLDWDLALKLWIWLLVLVIGYL